MSQQLDEDQIGRVVAIRYKGRNYDHYGILDGLGNVIHVNKRKNIISCDPMTKVFRDAKRIVYMQDDEDTRRNQYERAQRLVGSSHQYRFLTDNCETWINKIRTGQTYCRQVDQAIGTLSMIILAYSGIKALSF